MNTGREIIETEASTAAANVGAERLLRFRSQHVSCAANSPSHYGREVVIAFWGPRGGTRAIESVSPATARKLAADLLIAAQNAEDAP